MKSGLSLALALGCVVWQSACEKSSDPQGNVEVAAPDSRAEVPPPADQTVEPDLAAEVRTDLPSAADAPSADSTSPQDLAVQPGPPAPKAYSNGTCPVFTAGTNTFKVGTRERKFELWVPEKPKGAPLVFIWHGLGDSPKNIAAYFQAEKLAKERGAVVVAPYDCCSAAENKDCCSTPYVWGFGSYSSDSDMMMFDDLLACVDELADIDNSRVYTTGFSAGALWSTHLVIQRGAYLAAAVLFSGGTGSLIKYSTPGYKVPVLLAHGGETDIFAGGLVKFKAMTLEFAEQLFQDGHVVALCDHGLGHSVPYDGAIWDAVFLFNHQWSDGSSPFKDGLTSEFPNYCAMYSPPND